MKHLIDAHRPSNNVLYYSMCLSHGTKLSATIFFWTLSNVLILLCICLQVKWAETANLVHPFERATD